MQSDNGNGRGRIFAVALLLVTAAAACHGGQINRTDVPAAVLSVFESNYPDAQVWSYAKVTKGRDVLYEIRGNRGGTEFFVVYDDHGAAVKTAKNTPAPFGGKERRKKVKSRIKYYTKNGFTLKE